MHHILSHHVFLYPLAGLFVGLFIGQTGVGAGSMMTPLLILFFGLNPVTAVGTDLFYAAATKFTGTLTHGFNKTVNFRLTALLVTGTIPGTLLALLVIDRFSHSHAEARAIILPFLGVMMLISATLLFIKRDALKKFSFFPKEVNVSRRRLFTLIIGFILGFLITMTSVGAGSLGVAVLILLYPELKVSEIVGTDIAYATALTLIAGFGHWLVLGHIEWAILGLLLIGSVPGVIIGSLLADKIPQKLMRAFLAVILTAVAVRIFM